MSVQSALRSRIRTALVLAAVFIGVVFGLPESATLMLVAVAIVLGAWEWSAMLQLRGRPMRIAYVALVAVVLFLAWWLTRDQALLRPFLFVTALWWVVALAWLSLAPARVNGWSAGLAGLLSLVPAGVALAQFRLTPGSGSALTLFAIVLIVAADTGAFFVGRALGRVALAPRVSPGKTWEGVLGGLALSLLVAFAGSILLALPVLPMVMAGFIAAAFSVVGDLTESMLKRHAGIKDSGSLFPGHGGVLDRIDSIMAGAPMLLLGLLQIGVLE